MQLKDVNMIRLFTLVVLLIGISVAEEAPRFTTEQKKEIVSYLTKMEAIQPLQSDLQKFIPEVCKPPKWKFSPSVPNAEGTGTEPGCVSAPPPAPEKK